jgi:hypothetical protein
MYPPGKTYEYCNLNYRLLGLIIEKLSGKSYGTFIKEAIFDVLSMRHSYANPADAEDPAEGYGQIFGFPVRRKQHFYPGALPSGYLISSVSDVSAFLIEELRASQGKSGIFPQELIESTWSAPNEVNTNYAKGWMSINRDNGSSFLIHGGSLENYQSFFYLDPSSQKGFVFLMNQGGFFPMAGAFNTVRDGLIKIINEEDVSYTKKNKIVYLNIIIPLAVLLIQVILFFLIPFWKRHLYKRKIWSKLSIGINIFWSIFFLFILVPLMNAIMGDTATLGMIGSMFPELLIALLIIVISNMVRATIKTRSMVNDVEAGRAKLTEHELIEVEDE